MVNSRNMCWAWHVACTRTTRIVYKVSVGKSEGKRPLGRIRHTWGDDVIKDFEDMGWEDEECFN
jgi:hypothetical protein